MKVETVLVALLTFACGAAYELGCVFWVHYSERERTLPAVGWSMFNAVVTIVGIESFLKSWIFAIAYIFGFGFGTAVAIRIKRRLQASPGV